MSVVQPLPLTDLRLESCSPMLGRQRRPDASTAVLAADLLRARSQMFGFDQRFCQLVTMESDVPDLCHGDVW
jgi:hypothetical protein